MSGPTTSDALALLIADIYEAAGALRSRGDLIAAVAGQTQSRWQVLSVLSDGSWTVPRIARRLGVSRQAVQRTADQLRDDGMIDYEANPDHERSPLARLTPSGLAALGAITTAANGWHQLAAAGLTPEDLMTARSVLQALSIAAHAEPPDGERALPR